MTDQEITVVVSRIIADRVTEAGFRGAEAFDGDPIIRVTAHYERRPKAKPDPLIDVVHALRSALIAQGDDRFVFLTNDVAEERQVEEELD